MAEEKFGDWGGEAKLDLVHDNAIDTKRLDLEKRGQILVVEEWFDDADQDPPYWDVVGTAEPRKESETSQLLSWRRSPASF